MEQTEQEVMQNIPTGTPVKHFSVTLPNRVGALLELVKVLNESHVEIIGLCLLDSVDVSIVRMVVSDPMTVERVFDECAVNYYAMDIVVVELTEGAAGLGACLSSLLVAETNVNFTYPLMNRPNGRTLLGIHVEDHDIAGNVLHHQGFRLIFQEDLSR